MSELALLFHALVALDCQAAFSDALLLAGEDVSVWSSLLAKCVATTSVGDLSLATGADRVATSPGVRALVQKTVACAILQRKRLLRIVAESSITLISRRFLLVELDPSTLSYYSRRLGEIVGSSLPLGGAETRNTSSAIPTISWETGGTGATLSLPELQETAASVLKAAVISGAPSVPVILRVSEVEAPAVGDRVLGGQRERELGIRVAPRRFVVLYGYSEDVGLQGPRRARRHNMGLLMQNAVEKLGLHDPQQGARPLDPGLVLLPGTEVAGFLNFLYFQLVAGQ